MSPEVTSNISVQKSSYWLGGLVWALGWLAIYLFDAYLDVSNLALLLILVSAIAAVCFPWRIAMSLMVAFVFVFNWFFIPPRGTFTIDFHQHTLMLMVILVVNTIIVSSMALRRAQSELAERHAREADTLRKWSDALLESSSPHEHLSELQLLLSQLSCKKVSLLVLRDVLPTHDDPQGIWQLGEAGIEQLHALWYCTRNNQQLGRGTGRYEMFSDVYLPLRARNHALGAVLLGNFAEHEFSTRVHLQAICDQFGNALERYRFQQQELASREHAQSQLIRNNLLAAISHDYRTPLATIMGAASSLLSQAAKLDVNQQRQLSQRIYDEAERLNSVTHNILQLARLDADTHINCDWQSAEEIVGDLLRRWRGRESGKRLQIELHPKLPLVWCDPVLIAQLLENLVDNALKYSPADTFVVIHTNTTESYFLFSVSDNGAGIDVNVRNKIFEPFQRGVNNKTQIPGTGVGLALCKAIAQAHSGEMKVECPTEGGSRFTVSLPLRELPRDVVVQNSAKSTL